MSANQFPQEENNKEDENEEYEQQPNQQQQEDDEEEEQQQSQQQQQQQQQQKQKGSSTNLNSKNQQKDDQEIKNPNYYEKNVRESINTSPNRRPTDKTFMTLQKKEEESQVWKPFDFLFPAGRLSKLVKVFDVYYKNFPFSEMLNKLKMTDGYPVVNLIGAAQANRGKFYAGLARAAFNSEAVIIDSAIETGLEAYVIRRDLTLIGVAPENAVRYPKINPTYKDPFEISNGHTHLFLVSNISILSTNTISNAQELFQQQIYFQYQIDDKEKTLEWSQETLFKIQLALKIAEGKVSKKGPRCKIVNVLLADTPHYLDEVRLAVKYDLPIIVAKGSAICDEIIKNSQSEEDGQWDLVDPEMQELLQKGHFYMLDSIDSEDIAQYLHFLLTFTPY